MAGTRVYLRSLIALSLCAVVVQARASLATAASVVLDPLAPWPKKHHDLRNTGQSPYLGPTGPNVQVHKLYEAVTRIQTSPTIGRDGTIYLGIGFTPLYAINPDGSEKWRTTDGGDARHSSPTIGWTDSGETVLYIGARDNKLWAVQDKGQSDYTVLWQYKVPRDGDVFSSPSIGVDGDKIYMACGCVGGGVVHALDPFPPTDAGEVLWEYIVEKSIRHASPAVNDLSGTANFGTMYIGDTFGVLHAFKRNPAPLDNPRKWKSERLGKRNRHSSPVIGPDGTIYIGSYQGLHAVVDPGVSTSDEVPAVWAFSTTGRVESTPALAGGTPYAGTLYVGDSTGWFYAINSVDGTLLWKIHLEKPIRSSPALGNDGTIYVAGKKTVYALSPKTVLGPGENRILWQAQTKGPIKWVAPALGDNGTLYIGSNKYLYAFHD